MAFELAGRYGPKVVFIDGVLMEPGALIQIVNFGTTDPATIYTSKTMAVQAPNPLTVDAAFNIMFFAPEGDYAMRHIVGGNPVGSAVLARVLPDPVELASLDDVSTAAAAVAESLQDHLGASGDHTAGNVVFDATDEIDAANVQEAIETVRGLISEGGGSAAGTVYTLRHENPGPIELGLSQVPDVIEKTGKLQAAKVGVGSPSTHAPFLVDILYEGDSLFPDGIKITPYQFVTTQTPENVDVTENGKIQYLKLSNGIPLVDGVLSFSDPKFQDDTDGSGPAVSSCIPNMPEPGSYHEGCMLLAAIVAGGTGLPAYTTEGGWIQYGTPFTTADQAVSLTLFRKYADSDNEDPGRLIFNSASPTRIFICEVIALSTVEQDGTMFDVVGVNEANTVPNGTGTDDHKGSFATGPITVPDDHVDFYIAFFAARQAASQGDGAPRTFALAAAGNPSGMNAGEPNEIVNIGTNRVANINVSLHIFALDSEISEGLVSKTVGAFQSTGDIRYAVGVALGIKKATPTSAGDLQIKASYIAQTAAP